ncbi:SPL family radical SAM protein [Metallosphaera javensis (ex Sakai et al. 2022)]|uniref:SPL family radical SAM protein n=1 Tax=Metallosphaera javensis (ex Sakai et al. 2022) TaxID=2775498 RepID=UPI002585C8D8|nr:MAG: hypothetical protein MjAS7_0844 [Metallosphaera javensis (ex Sakai et al. 2022)]
MKSVLYTNEQEKKRHERRSLAAKKAWETIRKTELIKNLHDHNTLDNFFFELDTRFISFSEYEIKPPLIKPSKLTSFQNGGVGKELSDGWALNFAVGCTHGCRFCYVDNIHKRFTIHRVGNIVNRPWGMYFLKPRNIEEAIAKTPWKRWKNRLVMMSSTHDPYLPQLYPIPREILQKALPAGVRFLIQTRSVLALKDLDILSKYREQVIVQVSIATMDEKFASLIEPRVSPPKGRVEILRKAKEAGLRTGVIVAPVFPPNKVRPDVREDLRNIIDSIADYADNIFGEMIHRRGVNLGYIEEELGRIELTPEIDEELGDMFYDVLAEFGLKGTWWYELRKE